MTGYICLQIVFHFSYGHNFFFLSLNPHIIVFSNLQKFTYDWCQTEADIDISINWHFFKEKNQISKRFMERKIKRYRGIIQIENYKTW